MVAHAKTLRRIRRFRHRGGIATFTVTDGWRRTVSVGRWLE